MVFWFGELILRLVGWIAAVLILGAVAVLVGLRFALILWVGVGLGFTLERLGFGFAGPWRRLIRERDGRGVVAQCWAIGLVAIAIQPMIASSDSLVGAIGPVSLSMAAAALVFGFAMQIVLGCGSGTLVNAGSGNWVALVALPAFCIGSFLGSLWVPRMVASTPHVPVDLGAVFGVSGGLAVTLFGLAVLAICVYRFSTVKGFNRRWMWAATMMAAFAIAHVAIAGQPWGVVYGLGLWVAKVSVALGWDPSVSIFWSAPVNARALSNSVLTDTTSLTSIGLIAGAAFASFKVVKGQPLLPALPGSLYLWIVLAGLALGISSRLAFGCNVGALFSGIASGSLHGWVWLVFGFVGSIYGVRAREQLWAGVRS